MSQQHREPVRQCLMWMMHKVPGISVGVHAYMSAMVMAGGLVIVNMSRCPVPLFVSHLPLLGFARVFWEVTLHTW